MSKEQLLNKEAVKAITQQITPEQAEYVRGVKQIIVDLHDGEYNKSKEDISKDIIFVAKIMAFTDKFKQLHWASCSMSMHKTIDDLEMSQRNLRMQLLRIFNQLLDNSMVMK